MCTSYSGMGACRKRDRVTHIGFSVIRLNVIGFCLSDHSLSLSLDGLHSREARCFQPEDFAFAILCLECFAPQMFACPTLSCHSHLLPGRPLITA